MTHNRKGRYATISLRRACVWHTPKFHRLTSCTTVTCILLVFTCPSAVGIFSKQESASLPVKSQATGDLSDVALLCLDADSAYQRGDFTTALGIFQRAKDLAEQSNDKDLLGLVLYSLGRCNFALNRLTKAREFYLMGRDVVYDFKKGSAGQFEETAQARHLIHILSDLGTLYIHMRRVAEAKQVALEGLSLSESLIAKGKPEALSTAQSGMAIAFVTLGNVAAANIFREVRKFSGFRDMITDGGWAPLTAWLQDGIHRHGGSRNLKEALTHLGLKLDVAVYVEMLRERWMEARDLVRKKEFMRQTLSEEI